MSEPEIQELDPDVNHQHLVRVTDFLDPENPRSMVNITIPILQEACQHTSVRFNLKKDEFYLAKMVKPTPTVNRLRLSFWKEYERAQNFNENMISENIWRGVCSEEQFLRLASQVKVQSWILYPVVDYDVAVEEALNYGIGRIREIFDFPLYETKVIKTGEDHKIVEVPNTKVADLMLKAVKMLDDRVKGGITHKIEQTVTQENKNLHLHKNVDEPVTIEQTPDLLEEEIRKLESKVTGKDNQVIEAEVVDGSTAKTSEAESTEGTAG